MKRIYKYNLTAIAGEQTIFLPKGSVVLSVKNQYENPVLYYAIIEDEEMEIKNCKVYVAETGKRLSIELQNYVFLGTLSFSGGLLMYHIFVEKGWVKDEILV